MSNSENFITIRDIGPHTTLQVPVRPGLNVVCGTNESGKSIAVRAVSALAGGDAKSLPIRDGQPSGVVSGFGTTLSISLRNQRAGELRDIEPVTDRLDLSALVNPGIKDKASANKHRIRALLNLTGSKMSYRDFREILPEDRRDEINDEFEGDDPLDLHGKIKREMEKRARHYKTHAEQEEANAKAIFALVDDIDFSLESDESVLREKYQAAVTRKAELEAEMKSANSAIVAHNDAAKKLESHDHLPDLEAAEEELSNRKQFVSSCHGREAKLEAEIEKLQRDLEKAKAETVSAEKARDDQIEIVAHARRAHESVAGLKEIISKGLPENVPTDEDLQAVIEEVRAAEEAVAAGVAIRNGKEKQAKAKAHVHEQVKSQQLEQVYRDAAHATDVVLSSAVSSPYFGVEQGELTAKDRRGKWMPFSALSEGARYKTAILAMAHVLEPDTFHLATLDQAAFDGLSTKVRDQISAAAEEHNIAIVTGELTDDEEISVYHYEPKGELVVA